jgi:hypothetical protein
MASLRTTATVVRAEVAPEGSWRMARGVVQVLVDVGGTRRSVARRFRLDEHRWLVPGMDVAVLIDPEHPDDFDIEWDAVASMEDRAALNDPVLADPIGARRAVDEALEAALVGQLAQAAPAPVPVVTPDRFEEAMARAAQTPAPSGWVRAVVLVATIRGVVTSDEQGHRSETVQQKSSAVLSVNVPGRPPYAVFVRKFKFPRRRADITGAGLPALVSVDDQNEVKILWDELPGVMDQVEQRLGDAMSQVQAAMGPQPTMPQYADPDFQRTMVEGAKRALAYVQDPAQRRALIEQYRAAGINVDDP